MSIAKDREFYKLDPDTGQYIFDYVIRPSINRNDLGPIPVGSEIEILILKNSELVVSFDYKVIQPIPDNKQLYAAAGFNLREVPIGWNTVPLGEKIVCHDVQIVEKVGDEYQLSYVSRPRNIIRDNLGPFVMNDVIVVQFLTNGNIFDSLEYTVTTPMTTGMTLIASGTVDFVEVVY